MRKTRRTVWAKMHQVELALDRVDKRMDARAAALRNRLCRTTSETDDVLWGNPEVSMYTLPERRELQKFMAPVTVTVDRTESSQSSCGDEVTGGTMVKVKSITLEDQARDLQTVINALLNAKTTSVEHKALCEEQATYLARERDRLIAKIEKDED